MKYIARGKATLAIFDAQEKYSAFSRNVRKSSRAMKYIARGKATFVIFDAQEKIQRVFT